MSGVYKNKERKLHVPHVPQKYIPNYVRLGIDPVESLEPMDLPVKGASTRSSQTIPNIGNNEDYHWASMDGDIDPDYDQHQKMIDNNDLIEEHSTNQRVQQKFHPPLEENSATHSSVRSSVSSQEEIGDYALLVNKKLEFTGTQEEMTDYVSALIFGEHPDYPGVAFHPEDLIVLKRVKIKAGVFID